jgi:hypothetical protein
MTSTTASPMTATPATLARSPGPPPPRGPAPGIDPDLKSLLRRLKLGRILDTLPERLALVRANSLPHSDFLSLILTDEVERRDRSSAELRARTAKLDSHSATSRRTDQVPQPHPHPPIIPARPSRQNPS